MFLDSCPEGDGYVIILESCYYIEKEALNNADAIKNCQTRNGFTYNGRLFEPRDSTTNHQVIESAKMISQSTKFWIGINDLGTEGTFQYTTGGDLVYTNWANGEPNNANFDGEDCVETYSDATWNDQHCTDQIPSICEMI